LGLSFLEADSVGFSVGEDARKLSMDLLGGRVGMHGVSLVGLVVEGGEEGVDLSLVLQTPK
jgi:hypothetical protein